MREDDPSLVVVNPLDLKLSRDRNSYNCAKIQNPASAERERASD